MGVERAQFYIVNHYNVSNNVTCALACRQFQEKKSNTAFLTQIIWLSQNNHAHVFTLPQLLEQGHEDCCFCLQAGSQTVMVEGK
jgi:hypothetical protein